jgi:adenylate cyclase
MLAWLLGSAIPLMGLGLSPLLTPIGHQEDRLPWLALAGVVGGGLVMGVAAISVSRPLNRVRSALRRVERGDLDVHLPVDDLGELGRLSEGVNDLVAGLRERDQLMDLFGRQVGQLELATIADEGGLASIGSPGEAREVTVLFVDLRGYTRYSERHPPAEVVRMLNRFFRVVVAVVNREGGWVNKFEGDAALCLFGAPQDQPDHAARALRAADSLPRELAHDTDLLPAGIGVATGEVIAGFIGTAERFEYTVIGDVVNLASRLCDDAKSSPAGVYAARTTIERAGWPDHWRSRGDRRVRGRVDRVEVFAPRRARRELARQR